MYEQTIETIWPWIVSEGAPYRTSHRFIRLVSDACCRVSESLQHIPQHSARGKCAYGFFILDENDLIIEKNASYLGELTINQAEYFAVIKSLDRAVAFCRGTVDVWLDSEVVAKQLNGDFCIRSELVKPLFDDVKKLEMRFREVRYFHHNRGSHWAREADKLANDEYSRVHKG